MFTEVLLGCDKAQAEALSDALIEAGALSATIEDADAGSAHETPLYGEPGLTPEVHAWDRSRIVALFDEDTDIDGALLGACTAVGLTPPAEIVRRAVEDADWVRLTQAQFDTIAIPPRLFIVPSWRHPPQSLPDDAVLMELDPGLAFGTGSHPTTQLCLEWLQTAPLAQLSLLDYGCGSGILAIAAARLGARAVTATDIDPQALVSSRDNAAINRVAVCVEDATQLSEGRYDVVIANILSNPLKLLAPLLAARVDAHGWLVLSGVLQRQIDEVVAAYAQVLPLSVWATRDGWACLIGKRAA